MKRLITVLCTAFLMSACGGSGGGSGSGGGNSCAIQGTWTGTVNGLPDTLTIPSSCSYTSSYCQSVGSFGSVTTSSGPITVNTTNTNGNPECFSSGSAGCSFSVSATTLSFNCATGFISYTR